MIRKLGKKSTAFFQAVYELFLLFLKILKCLPFFWFYRRQIIERIHVFSVNTLPIASVIAVFIGLGAMIQGTYQTTTLIPRAYTVNVIFKSMTLELCPIIISLILAGKLGGSLAAEIGSMKISEQIEALQTLSIDPIGFLILPRVLACLIMLPIITIYANFIATFSVFFGSTVLTKWISPQEFFSGLQLNFRAFELYFGNLIKPAVFGFFIALAGSFFGLKSRGGAIGIGKASTNAVVVSAVFIVLFDYYLGAFLL